MRNAKVTAPVHSCIACSDKGTLRNGEFCYCKAGKRMAEIDERVDRNAPWRHR